MKDEVGRIVLCKNVEDVLVLDVISHVANDERPPWFEGVDGLEFLLLDLDGVVHFCVHITHVLQGREEVALRDHGLYGVIEHGGLPHAFEGPVDLFRGFSSRHGVDAKGDFEK